VDVAATGDVDPYRNDWHVEGASPPLPAPACAEPAVACHGAGYVEAVTSGAVMFPPLELMVAQEYSTAQVVLGLLSMAVSTALLILM
jgi:hypothetical protein